MKSRTGYVYQDKVSKAWYARVCYTQPNGKRTSIKRRVDSKSHGNEVIKQLVETFERGGRAAFDAEKITTNDLCDYYLEHYGKPAEYANGRKVAGLRSVVAVKGYVKVFREYFGGRLLKSITYDDLRTFRAKRLKTSTHQSKQRSLTTVNREMAYLRRLLNIAERNSWIARNPFKLGDALIHAADERKRERILTPEECQQLIDACTGYRAHLRPIVIAGLDTGCRLRELLKLRWRDVDMNAGIIVIQAFNTKTMRERQVSITTRLMLELETLRPAVCDSDALVFGIATEIRQGFRNACRAAGLEQTGVERVVFHTLRHTHATRLDELGFSLARIGGQLGHTVVQTTLRYAGHRDRAAIKAVGQALDAYHVGVNDAPTITAETIN